MSGRLARWQKRLSYQALLLGTVALVTSTALTGGHRITIDDIAARRREDLLSTLAQVLPKGRHDSDPLADTVRIPGGPLTKGTEKEVYRSRREGQVTGAAFRVEGKGYGGPIRLLMGVDQDGRISGVRVLSHSETPGLGDKIELGKSDWIRSFRDRSLTNTGPGEWAVKKDGGVFDQFTGATITPRAVVKAVHRGLRWFRDNQDRILSAPPKGGAHRQEEGQP